MRNKKFYFTLILSLLVIASLLPLSGIGLGRSGDADVLAEEGTFEAGVAEAAAPVMEEMVWSEEIPALTAEQEADLAYWAENTGLPGPEQVGADAEPSTPPAAGTETIAPDRVPLTPLAPLAPGDAAKFRRTIFGTSITGGKSNVMESSVAEGGKYTFFTGNWFAAQSTSNGKKWTYVSSYSGFSDFCCDQVTIYDEARDRFYWLRMGRKDAATGTNVFKLSGSSNGGFSFYTYTFAPTNTNAGWTNQWWDYPHIQLGADYLYLTWNMFNISDQWVRSVILRFPLDALATASGFSYNYYTNSSWFTFVPVQGADHIMYFASNQPTTSPFNRIAIWKWQEDSTGITSWVKDIHSWTNTNRNTAMCGAASGNWAARTDDRLLSGARYMIHGTNVKHPGRKVLGWWWNVQEGGGFAYPYIDGVAFYEDTMTQVTSVQGRPYVYSSVTCFLYPSFAANSRGDLGGVLNYSTGTAKMPSSGFVIADDYETTPPGFLIYFLTGSNARPSDNVWGDYNTARVLFPAENIWAGGVHKIVGTTNCSNCSDPVYVSFGRMRDRNSWARWKTK